MRCAACGGVLGFRYDDDNIAWDETFRDSMWRYWRLLPVERPEDIVTLGEGGTPLLRSRTSAGPEVWLKDETRNPTGSHKDRALAVALSHGHRLDQRVSVVVSAGSTGTANAAFSARAGMQAIVVVVHGVPPERLYPAFALGAEVVEVDADIDTVVQQVAELGSAGAIYDSSTARRSNPYQAEGPKTIAYEVVEQLGRVPDWMVIPIGGGGTVSGVWRGFEDLVRLGRTERRPRLLGVVAKGYDAIARALDREVQDPDTVFTTGYRAQPTVLVKIAHVYPPDGMEAMSALRDSGGLVRVVDDHRALTAQRRFGNEEGIFIEPSSAGVIAALEDAIDEGIIEDDKTVVVLLSGSGFREAFATATQRPLTRMAIELDDLPGLLSARVTGWAKQ